MNILYVNSLEASNKELARQLASCQAALADTEALEIGTGERLAKVEQRLAAANGLIAEQNKLGKERQEWALHTSDVIRSLNQQLAEALEQNLVLSKQTDHTILDLSNYVDSLEQQLAGAIAACKQKDESIEAAHNGLRWWMDAFPLHVTEADNKEMLKLVKALTIQPDDSALKAWLGGPVARLIPVSLPDGDRVWARTFDEYSQESSETNVYRNGPEIPLYSPNQK